MATIAELGIKVDTSQVKAAATNLDTLSTTAKKTQAAANDTTDKLGQLGRKAGMAGIQIQQFVGQVQGGQNVMGALSAQATDLGFVLGAPLIGAVVGLSAAFAGPLVSALGMASTSSDDLLDNIEKLTDGFKNATSAQKLFIAQDAAAKMEEEAETIRKATKELKKLEEQEQRLITGKGRTGRMKASKASLESINELSLEIAKQKAIIDTAQQSYDKYGDVISGVGDTEKERATELQKFLEKLKEEAALTGATAAKTTEYHLAKLNATDTQTKEAMALQDTIDKKKALIEAEKEAVKYANAFALAQSASITNAQKNAQVSFDALEASQRDQLQVIYDRYLQEKAIIANALGAEVITIEQAKAAKLASDKSYADQKRALDMATNKSALSASASFFGNMAAIAAAGGEEQFQTWKRMSQAQAMVSAALAVVNALAAAPPPFNIALAGSIGALAAVQVAQIENTQYSPARALGGQGQPGETYTVGENGPEKFTVGSMGGYFTSNDKLQGKGDTYVMQLSAGVTGTVRAEMAAMMPMIMKTVSQTVRSARR